MIDMQLMVRDAPRICALLEKRGVDLESMRRAMNWSQVARAKQQELEALQAFANKHQRLVRGSVPEPELLQIKQERARLREEWRRAKREMAEAVGALPNLPHSSTPNGLYETDNVIVAEYPSACCQRVNRDAQERPQKKEPASLSSRIAGAGFEVLCGDSARMLRALANFALQLHTGTFEELCLPALVSEASMFGSGHLPKFANGAYSVEGGHLWLAPTAEVAFCALHRTASLEATRLPARYISYTTCFRREVGGGGNSARFRLHQYHQVELFSVCDPSRGLDELAFMLKSSERALQCLELRYRSVELCCGQLPFSAAKAYKLEVFLPRSNCWIDVSTISLATDFLARRNSIRLIADRRRVLVHTLNASGLACSRVRIALEEHGFTGRAGAIPPALKPYF